jgi:indoleamine 2,3-dioxygenase
VVARSAGAHKALAEAYDAAVCELEAFRAQHRAFAARYIAQFSAKETGTGGSDFMPALSGYKATTAAHRLR